MRRPADGGSPVDRRRSVALAGHLHDEPRARAGLDDPDPSVRATALGALARLGRLRVDDLTAALGDRAPEVRARAAELGVAVGPAAESLIVEALSDPDPRVVESGCFALGELGRPAAGSVKPLCRVAGDHPDPLCRETAVAALGAIGDPAGLDAIVNATSDKPAVRRRAVLALAPFDGPIVEQTLARALTDRDWQVRQAAEDLSARRATTPL
jgi:HEAT repeat protein